MGGLLDGLSKIILALVSRNLAEVTVEAINSLLLTLKVFFLRNLASLSQEGTCLSDLCISFTADHRYVLLFCIEDFCGREIWDRKRFATHTAHSDPGVV